MEPDPLMSRPFPSGHHSMGKTSDPTPPASDARSWPATEQVPSRYEIKEDETGRYLTCLEAPEIKVYVERGFSATSSAARKYAEGTIFLDGAAQAEPFLDLERRIYNLDHHEGCVRRFTLATCEQALVLMLRGLDLRERPWTVYANEPDLDTQIAIWVLLNGVHLHHDGGTVRSEVIPLVRLEGVIDTHGLQMRDFVGFREEHLAATFSRLESLREPELALKAKGSWAEIGFLEFMLSQLEAIDRMVYPQDFFETFRGVEELAREELSDDRIVVVCAADCGIYEVEKDLKRRYGKRLGLVALRKDERTYTIRQVDSFLPVNLEAAYERLNVLDPAVKGSGSANSWGGSGEIGGSPRATGTQLSPEEIASACRLAYRQPPLLVRLGSVGLAVLLSGLAMLTGWLAESRDALTTVRHQWEGGQLPFVLTGLAVGALCVAYFAKLRRRRLFGLQLPVGQSWLWTAPAALVGGLLGGAWVVPTVPGEIGLGARQLQLLLLFPLLAEVLFRALAHGTLVRNFHMQRSTGRWFLSWPVGVSAALYTLWTLALWRPPLSSAQLLMPGVTWLVPLIGALVLGIGLGMARERSGSLLAPLALHYLAAAAVVALAIALG